MILNFFRKDPRREVVEALYRGLSAAARREALYRDLGVPDSIEGRFEALVLHVVLVMRALRRLPSPADEVAQDLTNLFFRQLDFSLREMGVGDTAVPKRMKALGEAYYGRARTYDPALEAGDRTVLEEALARNVYGGERPAGELARYALAAERALAAQSLDGILAEGPAFPPPEDAVQEGAP
jgi:cytochrome b pre-mRNA-processing protein 3